MFTNREARGAHVQGDMSHLRHSSKRCGSLSATRSLGWSNPAPTFAGSSTRGFRRPTTWTEPATKNARAFTKRSTVIDRDLDIGSARAVRRLASARWRTRALALLSIAALFAPACEGEIEECPGESCACASGNDCTCEQGRGCSWQ